MVGTGQKLAVRPAFDGQRLGIGVALAEILDLEDVLGSKYRACDVKHFATRRQGLPKAIEDRGLLPGKAGNVLGAAQPLDVGMTADYATA